jgi:hypothetical protein
MFDGICTEGLRVPPGGVLDTYYTDEGYESLGYCAPHGVISAPAKPSPMFVTVVFLDDEGRSGGVEATLVWK